MRSSIEFRKFTANYFDSKVLKSLDQNPADRRSRPASKQPKTSKAIQNLWKHRIKLINLCELWTFDLDDSLRPQGPQSGEDFKNDCLNALIARDLTQNHSVYMRVICCANRSWEPSVSDRYCLWCPACRTVSIENFHLARWRQPNRSSSSSLKDKRKCPSNTKLKANWPSPAGLRIWRSSGNSFIWF